jgi:hypothetical protein
MEVGTVSEHKRIAGRSFVDISVALWRLPYGQSGVMTFFLQLIASKEDVSTTLVLHALRLVGNSCADTGQSYSLPRVSTILTAAF